MGYFNDPWDCPGLAHLFEHTLMRGSAEQLGLHDVAQEFNTELHAFTGMYDMTFTAAIPQPEKDALEKAILARIQEYQPTLPIIEQEMKVICQEFSNGHLDPVKRIQEVVKTTCNPRHPYAKFASGNVYTFAMHNTEELQKRLRELHQYILHAFFGQAQPTQTEFSSVTEYTSLFNPDHLQKMIFVQTDNSQHKVIMSVQITKSTLVNLESLSVFMWLMNQLPKDAIPNRLKQSGLIQNFSVAIGLELAEEITIDVSFFLASSTPAQLHHVCHELLAYLAYQTHISWAASSCAYICSAAEIYAQIHQTAVPFLSVNTDDLKTIFARFTPQNIRILSLSSDTNIIPPGLPALRTPYYGTAFYITSFPDLSVTQVMTQPTEGTSLITPFDLPDSTQSIRLLDAHISHYTGPNGSCVLIPDNSAQYAFECYLSFSITAHSAFSSVARRIWGKHINQAMQLHFAHYLALGCTIQINVHRTGFTFYLKTHQCLAYTLYTACITYIENFATHSTWTFDLAQAIQSERNHLQQSKKASAMQQAFMQLRDILLEEAVEIERQKDVLDGMTVASIKQDMVQFLAMANAEYMLFGRIPTALAEHVKQSLNTPHTDSNSTGNLADSMPVNTQSNYVLPQHETVSAIGSGSLSSCVVYWHAYQNSPNDVAQLLLLEQLVYPPIFDLLRNEMALGYDVGSKFITHNQHPGFCVYYEYTDPLKKTNMGTTEFAYAEFNRQLSQRLLSLIPKNEALWERAKVALIQQLSLPYGTPGALAKQYWIMLGKFGALDYYEKMREVIEQLDYADFYTYVATVIHADNQLTIDVKA